MSESAVQAKEKPSSSAMPTPSEKPANEQMPKEVALAMLFTAAKALEALAMAQILTGHNPQTRDPVTYIRLPTVIVDPLLGFKSVGMDLSAESEKK